MAVDQRIERDHAIGQRGGWLRDDHGAGFVAALGDGLLQHGQQRARYQHGLRAAVLQHIGVVVGGEQRVDRHGHDAGVHRAEEAHGPVVAIVHQQQHAFFAMDAEGLQRGGNAADALGQLAVAHRAVVVDVGGLAGPLRVARDQVLGEIERRAGRLDLWFGGHACLPLWVHRWIDASVGLPLWRI